MLNLRDKDIGLIRKFFKLSTLQNSGYIPFIIAGTENGSGHNMIIRRIQQNKGYDVICFVSCHEFLLDAFRPIYQIIKNIRTSYDLSNTPEHAEVNRWLDEYENNTGSLHSEEYLVRLLSDYLISSARQHSILLIIENLHLASYFVLNFLNHTSQKMEIAYPRHPLNVLVFYRFEEFIDISFKKLIAEIAEKGMVITIRNIPQHEYQDFIEPLFFNTGNDAVQKLWLITRGNILIFSQVLDYLAKKCKPQNGRFDLEAALKLLPGSSQEFYRIYLSRFNRLENEIMEAIAYITAPVDQGFIEFLTKEQPQIIARAFRHLLKEKIISQTSFVSEKYNLISFDLRNYLLYRNNDEYKLGRFRYLLEKYEAYHQHELDRQLLILRNLSIQAIDKVRIYKYLKLLYATLPNNYNSFRRIEILYQLVMYETDAALLPDYVIKLSCALIEVGKNKSAIEIMQNHGSDRNIKTVDRFRIYLLLFELYLSMEYFNSATRTADILDRTFSENYPVYLLGMYYQSKIAYLIAAGKYGDALKFFSLGIHTNDFDREQYLVLKAEILTELGYLNNARHILLETCKTVEERNDFFQLCNILLKLGALEQLAGNIEKAEKFYTDCKRHMKDCEEANSFPIKILIGLAKLSLQQKNHKQVLTYLYEALNFENTSTEASLDSEIFCALGHYYSDIASFEKAVSCYKRAKYNYLGCENMKKRIYYTLQLAECYARFNQQQESENYYQELEKFITDDKYSHHKDNYYLSKARSALFLKDFDSALSYLEDMICRESDRLIFIRKTLLEMQIGYQIKNSALIKDSAEQLKPYFSEFGSFILHEVNRIKSESSNQQSSTYE